MGYNRLRPAIIMCVDCKGLGKADGTLYGKELCPACKGTGRVERVEME